MWVSSRQPGSGLAPAGSQTLLIGQPMPCSDGGGRGAAATSVERSISYRIVRKPSDWRAASSAGHSSAKKIVWMTGLAGTDGTAWAPPKYNDATTTPVTTDMPTATRFNRQT